MLAISNTFDTASIHAAGSTSWLDERSSSQLVEPASSCKRGISDSRRRLVAAPPGPAILGPLSVVFFQVWLTLRFSLHTTFFSKLLYQLCSSPLYSFKTLYIFLQIRRPDLYAVCGRIYALYIQQVELFLNCLFISRMTDIALFIYAAAHWRLGFKLLTMQAQTPRSFSSFVVMSWTVNKAN